MNQQVINHATLTRSASIGNWLDSTEQSNVCKKSVDSAQIKNKSVHCTGHSVKNPQSHITDAPLRKRVKLLHEFILASKERVSSDNLAMLQLVAGFCRIMKEEHDVSVRELMLECIH